MDALDRGREGGADVGPRAAGHLAEEGLAGDPALSVDGLRVGVELEEDGHGAAVAAGGRHVERSLLELSKKKN